MPDRSCEVCGARFWQGKGRPAKRCQACRPQAGRYGTSHQRLRKATLPAAYGSPCVRCGEVMNLGQPLDLDHDELGGYLGYAHASCNRSAGAAKRNAKAVAVVCGFHPSPRVDCPHSRAW